MKTLRLLPADRGLPTVVSALLLFFSATIGAQPTPTPDAVAPTSANASREQNSVLVRIGTQEQITAADVRAYAMRRTDLRALLNTAAGQRQLLDEIAMTRVLVLEGERLGEPRRQEPLPGVDPRFDDIYALAVYRRLAGECTAPNGEAESRQYYDAHPEAFRVPAQARVIRIILPKSLTVDKFNAQDWLGLQARAVAMGVARFDALVKRARTAASDLRQGDLGWIAIEEGSTEPLLGAIRQAGKGGLVGPLVDGDYVYLLQVADWRDAQLLPWEAVKHQVPTRAVQYCREEQRKRIQRELYQRYSVQIDDKLLRDPGAAEPRS